MYTAKVSVNYEKRFYQMEYSITFPMITTKRFCFQLSIDFTLINVHLKSKLSSNNTMENGEDEKPLYSLFMSTFWVV